MARKPGLGGVISTRTREDAREAAGRIGGEDELSVGASYAPLPAGEVVPAADSELVEPDEIDDNPDEGDDQADAVVNGAHKATAEPPAPAPRVSTRGRQSRQAATPASLLPSRVPQHRIQIGPRLRPSAHTQFLEYLQVLQNTGVTQSDIVESALIEYMSKYPADTLRAALLEGR